VFRKIADGEVVLLGPAFLQAYYLGLGTCCGKLMTDLIESLMAVFRDVFQAPAVE